MPFSHKVNKEESVAKVKEILQLDNLNVDFKYGYKIFTLNSGNRYLIKTKFILFVESNRLLRRSPHKSKIVELYLKGYTPTEIQRLTRHSLQSIERYIKDFSRVSILTQREESIDNIRLIIGISERLVKEYHELFIKYKDGDHKQRVEELVDNVTVYDSPMSFKKNAGMRM